MDLLPAPVLMRELAGLYNVVLAEDIVPKTKTKNPQMALFPSGLDVD